MGYILLCYTVPFEHSQHQNYQEIPLPRKWERRGKQDTFPENLSENEIKEFRTVVFRAL
jgi:hypothetical protein